MKICKCKLLWVVGVFSVGSLFPWVIVFLNSNIVSNQIISIVSNHRRFHLNRWKISSSNQFRIMTNHMKNATQITFALVFIDSLVSSKWVRLELHQGGGGWCSSTYVPFQFKHDGLLDHSTRQFNAPDSP